MKFAAATPVLLGLTAFPAVKATQFSWNPCYKEFADLFGVDYECDVFNVPLDYDKPNGPKIQLSLVRRPAPDQENRIGSLFVNPGGPGGSAVEITLYLGGLGTYILGDVLNRYDIVGVDPRGIALSTPLRCFGTMEQASEVFYDSPFPFTEEEIPEFEEVDTLLNDQCLQRGNKILGHTSTANVARDFDAISQALGEDKLNFYGFSYGTFLGMTYANMFPDKVGAFVLDGNIDPNAWSNLECGVTLTNALRSDQGALVTLEEFARQCDEAGENFCPIAGGAFNRISAVLEGLKTTPIPVILPSGEMSELDFALAVAFTHGVLYNPFAFPELAYYYALLEALAPPEDLGNAINYMLTKAGFASKRRVMYENWAEGFTCVACSDSCNPTDYQVIFDTGKAAAEAFGFFAEYLNWWGAVCAAWTTPDEDKFVGPYNGKTATPVLVVGNLYDPATRYESAATNRALLPNSVLLTVDVPGHCALDNNECADDNVAAYLEDPVLFASLGDRSCAAERNFFVPIPVDEGGDSGFVRGSLRTQLMKDIAFFPFYLDFIAKFHAADNGIRSAPAPDEPWSILNIFTSTASFIQGIFLGLFNLLGGLFG